MGLKPIKTKIKKIKKSLNDTLPCLDDEELESHVYTEKFKFSFSMVDYSRDGEAKEIEESVYGGNRFPLYKYEEIKALQYNFNFMINKIKEGKKKSLCAYYGRIIDYLCFINGLHNTGIKNLNNYKMHKLENTIDKVPSIREILDSHIGGHIYPSINLNLAISKKDFTTVLDSAYKQSRDIIKNYLNDILKTDLKKSPYTVNFEWYLDLIGVKDKKIRDIAEGLFLSRNFIFKDKLFGSTKIETFLTRVGCNTFNLSKLYEYNTILFCSNDNINWDIYSYVYTGCTKIFKNQQDLIDYFVPVGKETDLTSSDFTHITQYKYIKSILEQALQKKSKGVNILIYGAPGGGKTALSRVLIKDIGANSYEVKASKTNWTDSFKSNEVLSNDNRIFSFKIITKTLSNNDNAVILYDEAEDFFRKRDNKDQSKDQVNEILEENETPVIWTTNSLYCMENSFLRRFTYVLNIDTLPNNVYSGIMNKICNKYNVTLPEDIKELYIQHKPNLGIIEKTLNNFALSKEKDINNIRQDLLDSLKGMNWGFPIPKIATNAFTFNPELINASENLITLTDNIKKVGRLDFSMLLYGVPGSSKSSFAKHLAKELGLQVINKNYSELSSMWVGETEKNIAKLFEQAENEKALILLDEADVLLQDRTKSQRSWEITQTEALLTAMEYHPYPFIMTTNLYENLDPAVMRRIVYKVKHDYLTDEQVKKAFKFFFDIDLTEKVRLSKLTSGDFAVVKKQAEFSGKLNDKDWLLDRLIIEMNQKKALTSNKIKM